MQRIVVICGPGESGKDELATRLCSKLKIPPCQSTSYYAKSFIWDQLQQGKKSPELDELRQCGYRDEHEMHADRRNHREAWANLIGEYNADDPARMYRAMVEGGERVIVGIRRFREYSAFLGAFPYPRAISVWVDRPGVPKDPTCEVDEEDCHLTVNNHGTLKQLDIYADKLAAICRAGS